MDLQTERRIRASAAMRFHKSFLADFFHRWCYRYSYYRPKQWLRQSQLDAVRYGVMWWRAKWTVGTRNAAHPMLWTNEDRGGVYMGGVRVGSSRQRR